MKKILITSALPYANGPIHFGHLAGAYLPADCYARFQRLQGNDVLFISGSDEYGIAISLSAELAKRSPQEHVDIFHTVNKQLFEKLAISFDHYSRTTWKGHVEATYQYFQDLLANGFIEQKESEQLYSEKDDKFLADRYVVGTCPRCGYEAARGDECTKCGASYEATDLKNPRSKLSNSPLTLKKTTHWYLQLDLFKEKLTKWLETKSWKPNVVNFIKSYIQELRPRAITRDTSWGIPVPLPDGTGKVLYVWFDAPIGYISATKEWATLKGAPDRWKDYWLDPETKLVNFIGKDNIPFHAVIFPAMTMGQNMPYKLVDELPANEFYNLEGKQFSKSDNWYIDTEDFLTRYSADQIRYAIASNAPETSDSEFTWKDFQLKCNSELVGKFGNFIHRTLVFLKNNLGDKLPQKGALQEVDQKFLDAMQRLTTEIRESYDAFKVRRAAQLFMELAQTGNVYFDQKKPWQDAKAEATRPIMETTLACCLECVKLLALTSSPVIPEGSQQIWQMIGGKGVLAAQNWQEVIAMPVDHMVISEPKTIFRKIEDTEIEAEVLKLKSSTPVKPVVIADAKPEISIDDVRKLDLRIAKIISAERVPKSKKLLRLKVDTGNGERTIVAGIGANFQPDEIIGKQVVIVANLQPATLMGVESQGMVLAASSGDVMQLLELPQLPPGTSIA
ncbi:MAG: metG [Chlamydiia bacterium]|nr:metG [Chlamydiia bacterium]